VRVCVTQKIYDLEDDFFYMIWKMIFNIFFFLSTGLPGYGWGDKEEAAKKFQETAEKWFPRFEKSVVGPFFFGDKAYYCDFVLLNSLLYVDEVVPGLVDKYSKLALLRDKLVEIPSIKKFLASDKRKPHPTEEYKQIVRDVFF